MLGSKKMRPIIPYILWSGMSLALGAGLLIPMIVLSMPYASYNTQLMNSMFCMATVGFGEIFGALVIG